MPTTVYYSSASDGRILCNARTYGARNTSQEVWDAAHDNDGTGGSAITINRSIASNYIAIGTANGTPLSTVGMYIWRAFLYFDTAGLNPAAIITGLTLSLYIESDDSGGDWGIRPWSIIVQQDGGGSPHDPLVDGDYLHTKYYGNFGSLAQASFVVGAYNDIILPTTMLTPGGELRPVLRGSMDIDDDWGETDTDYSCNIWSADKGAGFLPRLTVTYTLAPGNVTYFSDAKDGYNFNRGPSWHPLREDAVASNLPNTTDELIPVGTTPPPPDYYMWRGYVYFDTSALDDEAIIVGASLFLYGYTGWFTAFPTDYLVVQSGQPTYPSDPLDKTDWDKDFYTSGNTQFACAGWSNVGYNDIPFDAGDFSWINKTGWTKLCLRLESEINGNNPGTDLQWLTFWSADELQVGERRPKLFIEYKLIGQGTATITCEATVVPRIIARPSLITAAATVESTAYRQSLHRETLAYTGTLAAGDSVAIDTGKMKATHWPASGGAVSVPQYLSGMPIDLLSGTNTIQYADDEAARTVGISIHHKPRDT